jgi:hypothetical protein
MIKRIFNWIRLEWNYQTVKRQLNSKKAVCLLCGDKLEFNKPCKACTDCLGFKEYEWAVNKMLKRELEQRLKWDNC